MEIELNSKESTLNNKNEKSNLFNDFFDECFHSLKEKFGNGSDKRKEAKERKIEFLKVFYEEFLKSAQKYIQGKQFKVKDRQFRNQHPLYWISSLSLKKKKDKKEKKVEKVEGIKGKEENEKFENEENAEDNEEEKLLISCDGGGYFTVFDIETGVQKHSIFADRGAINYFSVSPCSNNILYGGNRGEIRMINYSDLMSKKDSDNDSRCVGEVVFKSQEKIKINAISWISQDDKESGCLFGGEDGKVVLLKKNKENDDFSVLMTFVHDINRGVLTLDVSKNGKRFASAGADKHVKIFQIPNLNDEKAEFYINEKPLIIFEEHIGRVCSVCFSPLENSTKILSGGDDKSMKLFDSISGRLKRNFSGHSKSVKVVGFTSDETRAISGSEDMTLKIFHIVTGAIIVTLTGNCDIIMSFVFLQGKLISASSDRKDIRVFDIEPESEYILSQDINKADISKNGSSIAILSWDGNIIILDRDSKKKQILDLPENFFSIEDIQFCSNEELFIVDSNGKYKKIIIYNLISKSFSDTPIFENEGIESISISADGKNILFLKDQKLYLKVLAENATESDKENREIILNETNKITFVKFLPGQNAMFYCFSLSNKVIIKLKDGQETLINFPIGQDQYSICHALSPERKLFATGVDKILKIFDYEKLKEKISYRHTGEINTIMFSENYLFFSSDDGYIKLIDIENYCVIWEKNFFCTVRLITNPFDRNTIGVLGDSWLKLTSHFLAHLNILKVKINGEKAIVGFGELNASNISLPQYLSVFDLDFQFNAIHLAFYMEDFEFIKSITDHLLELSIDKVNFNEISNLIISFIYRKDFVGFNILDYWEYFLKTRETKQEFLKIIVQLIIKVNLLTNDKENRFFYILTEIIGKKINLFKNTLKFCDDQLKYLIDSFLTPNSKVSFPFTTPDVIFEIYNATESTAPTKDSIIDRITGNKGSVSREKIEDTTFAIYSYQECKISRTEAHSFFLLPNLKNLDANHPLFSSSTFRLLTDLYWERGIANKFLRNFVRHMLFTVLILINIMVIFPLRLKNVNSEISGYSKISLVFDFSQILFLLHIVSTELVDFKFEKRYLSSFWNNMDILQIVLGFAGSIMDIIHVFQKGENSTSFTNTIKAFLAGFFFLTGIRILEHARGLKMFSQLITMVNQIVRDMFLFLCIMFWILLLFALTAYLLQTEHQTNQWEFLKMFFFMVIGDYSNYSNIETALDLDLYFFILFFCTVSLVIVMLNLIIALMNESFTKVREKQNKTELFERLHLIISHIQRYQREQINVVKVKSQGEIIIRLRKIENDEMEFEDKDESIHRILSSISNKITEMTDVINSSKAN